MLETEPIRRYPTYDSLLGDMNKASKVAQQGPRKAMPQKEKPKRKGRLIISILTLSLIGTSGGAYFFLKDKKDEGTPKQEGPTVLKLINGKLIRVSVKEDPSIKNQPPVATPIKKADTYIAGKDKGTNHEKTNFGSKDVSIVRSVSADRLGDSAKTYIRFDFFVASKDKKNSDRCCIDTDRYQNIKQSPSGSIQTQSLGTEIEFPCLPLAGRRWRKGCKEYREPGMEQCTG